MEYCCRPTAAGRFNATELCNNSVLDPAVAVSWLSALTQYWTPRGANWVEHRYQCNQLLFHHLYNKTTSLPDVLFWWPLAAFSLHFGVSWGYKQLATSENGWASPLGQAHPFSGQAHCHCKISLISIHGCQIQLLLKNLAIKWTFAQHNFSKSTGAMAPVAPVLTAPLIHNRVNPNWDFAIKKIAQY